MGTFILQAVSGESPTIAALFGTAWAVAHPAFVRLRPGLVVPVRQLLGDVLVTALFWGAIGICAVMSAVFLMASAWYRLSGDRVWDATHADVVGPTATGLLLFFELRCRGPFPINPTTLGAVGCSVKTPNGALWTCPGDFVQRINPEGFIAWSSLAPQSGRYEVRWYANDGKRQVHEIARATLEAPSGGPITPGTVTAIPAGLAWLRENWRAELERENALRRERGQRAA